MTKKIEIIQLEINQTIRNSGSDAEELTDYLRRHDYRLCEYDPLENQLQPANYNEQVENYFAVYDLARANERLVRRKHYQS